MIFLCGGGTNQPARRPLREPLPGRSRQQMLPDPRARALTVGDLDSALAAVRTGLSYANMHTTNFPGVRFAATFSGAGGTVTLASNLRNRARCFAHFVRSP